MSKFIIDNRSDLEIHVVFARILEVMRFGRISNNERQFCYLSTFLFNDELYAISTDLNRKSDRFVVYKYTKQAA